MEKNEGIFREHNNERLWVALENVRVRACA